MDEKIIMIFHYKDKSIDIEVPLGITATELIFGLNNGFHLGIDMNDPKKCFLRAENPVELIRGEKTLEELGLRNGTSIFWGE